VDDYFICPNCGAEVPMKALACPECGSDDRTGWSEDTLYDGIEESSEFEEAYEACADPDPPPRAMALFHVKTFILVVALLCILALLAYFIR
jgi:hypothetical protein